ncbi:hypothetical protein SAMCFNEI73_Ch3643 [Sinorhizobium americanum]|uniref:Uncharacterized protein n=1 Tax=Sinorhizobium americanum TaxID=194963 RepID=A0A1L3LS56_9HYPH|nr:hypothetical protein SAMCFNEI73_Ch3643 [Sinorhizobium americanum]
MKGQGHRSRAVSTAPYVFQTHKGRCSTSDCCMVLSLNRLRFKEHAVGAGAPGTRRATDAHAGGQAQGGASNKNTGLLRPISWGSVIQRRSALGTAMERIGDESLTPADSLYVHGYI